HDFVRSAAEAMMVVYALCGVLALAVIAPVAIVLATSVRGNAVVYGVSLVVTLGLCIVGLLSLLAPAAAPAAVTLPFGLPWLGAHFRIDALSAFFVIVINLGAATASLFALGYGRHEEFPGRVLPFYPAYLAGMNLVLIAYDAFTFLVSWELMSLTSWALV